MTLITSVYGYFVLVAMSETHPHRRNPPWSRDELILALDLYVRHKGNPPGKGSPEIMALSSLLNAIGRGLGGNADFRNANGVYMKAMNFRRFDPAYISFGRVGLRRGNRDEAVVWETYVSDPDRLRAAAEAIQANAKSLETQTPSVEDGLPEGFHEAEEGRLLTVQHVRRERSRKLVDAKKALWTLEASWSARLASSTMRQGTASEVGATSRSTTCNR